MDKTSWHALSIDETLQQLNAGADGLIAAEASGLLARFGRKGIARRKPVSSVRLLFKQFADFFILALLFAVGLDGIEPVIEVPPAAQAALRQLTGKA